MLWSTGVRGMPTRTLLALCCCCWIFTLSAGAVSSDGQEPWLIVWKKGVDGDLLWDTLCPIVSTGDDAASFATPIVEEDLSTGAPAVSPSRTLKGSGSGPELVLNCTSRFSQLFNGFAGYFKLKELDIIKSRYKHSVDYVLTDRVIQVDSPPESLYQQQQQLQVGAEAGMDAPLNVSNRHQTAAGYSEVGHSMVLDFPAAASRPHRQLLFTPPQQLVDAAKRRMLPELYNATWGLDILDQGSLPLDDIYHYTYNGTGVHVYVLDTGIRTTHNEFVDPVTGRTRAMHAFDAVYGTSDSEDCHGHGTHVAAVVGGNTFGVAKNVTLHAVRVLACDGTAMVSALLKGLEWVAKNHIKPAVVHMSIEGSFSSIINQAVEQLIKVNHVHVVVSSGNSGKDACLASPASAPSAITVAAIDDKICRWAYANWGACVDVFAPGVAILSAVSNKPEGDAGIGYKTGTSMAAPFVTGVVAAYLEQYPGASPEEVQQKLYQKAVRGTVTDDPQGFATMYPSQYPDLLDISSTPNRLLQANLTGQAVLIPGKLFVVDNMTEPLEIRVALTQQPSDTVVATVTTPAAWDGTPMAVVMPDQLQFTPDNWNQPQVLRLYPRLVCDGPYFVRVGFQGSPQDGYPAIHTVLVDDSRPRSGENAAMARVIKKLPFNDTGDSTTFRDSYRCQATDASPDVVYSYTPPVDTDVAISTCGSGFDTKLLVSTDLLDPTTYMCNDDDRSCVTNTACSRLDVSLKAGTAYFIVVDGFSGASGEYSLSVTCNPTCPELPFTVDTSNPAAGPSEASGNSSPSPNQNAQIIQALLHLSRPETSPQASPAEPLQALYPPAFPTPRETSAQDDAHPITSPSPAPQPTNESVNTPSPRARPSTIMQAFNPPIGSAVGPHHTNAPPLAASPKPAPAAAKGHGSNATVPAPSVEEPKAPVVGGRTDSASPAVAQPAPSPPVTEGPLRLIQGSSAGFASSEAAEGDLAAQKAVATVVAAGGDDSPKEKVQSSAQQNSSLAKQEKASRTNATRLAAGSAEGMQAVAGVDAGVHSEAGAAAWMQPDPRDGPSIPTAAGDSADTGSAAGTTAGVRTFADEYVDEQPPAGAADSQSIAADGADSRSMMGNFAQSHLAAEETPAMASGPGPGYSQRITLVSDLGVGYMGPGHAGPDHAPPSIPVSKSGLGRGAGGFSSAPRMRQAGAFSSATAAGAPPDGQEGIIGPRAHGAGGFQHAAFAPWDWANPSETSGTQQTTAGSSFASTDNNFKGRRLEHKQSAPRASGGNDSQLQPNEYVNSSKHDGTVRDDSGWVAAQLQLGTLTSDSEQQVPMSMLPDEAEN